MTIEHEEVMQFFAVYGEALGTFSGAKIAEHYDTPCIFTGDTGGWAANDTDTVAQRFEAASQFYKEKGFMGAEPKVDQVQQLTPGMVLVHNNWTYRDGEGSVIYDADYIYALRKTEGGLKIAAVVAVNEQERAAAYFAAQAAGEAKD